MFCSDASKRSAQTLFMHIAAFPECVRRSLPEPNRRSGNAVLCNATTAEPVVRLCASTKRESGIKQGAHCLTCGGAVLFFLHLRVTGLEVNGAGAAVQSALPGLASERQLRRAKVTGTESTGRKLAFSWRSCSSRAPWWLLRLGVHERRRHSAFAPVCCCAILRTLGIALSIS